MKVLFYDVIQNSNAPDSLKTPALADRLEYSDPVTVTFDFPRSIDAVGIGFTDAKAIRLTWTLFDGYILNNMTAATPESSFAITVFGGNAYHRPDDFVYEFLPDAPVANMRDEALVSYDGSGLYEVPPVTASAVTIECAGGTYIGRFAAGKAVSLGTALAKEPSFNTTEKSLKTLSGQIIAGNGGYNFRSVGLDTRYKIGGEAMREIKAAYPGQIAKGFPFFLLFDSEVRRLPFYRMYAKDKSTNKFGFESGIHERYLFSRKFDFEECF
ncbi:MAG: hypothetical protein LBT00_08660 [Spirochaetaceae bacterium]|jgi:hypothetical protein|nr:hypothetical protein [Spirochaetaceae bacterium]